MPHILIPSNFTMDTLDCLPELAETFPGLELNVLLFHAVGLSNSITDLLMLSRRTKEEEFISQAFAQSCKKLEEALPAIKAVNWTCFYGTTMASFKNFLKANQIDFIACPTTFAHQSLSKQSLDPMLFLEKCGLPVIPVTPVVRKPAPQFLWAF